MFLFTFNWLNKKRNEKRFLFLLRFIFPVDCEKCFLRTRKVRHFCVYKRPCWWSVYSDRWIHVMCSLALLCLFAFIRFFLSFSRNVHWLYLCINVRIEVADSLLLCNQPIYFLGIIAFSLLLITILAPFFLFTVVINAYSVPQIFLVLNSDYILKIPLNSRHSTLFWEWEKVWYLRLTMGRVFSTPITASNLRYLIHVCSFWKQTDFSHFNMNNNLVTFTLFLSLSESLTLFSSPYSQFASQFKPIKSHYVELTVMCTPFYCILITDVH